ncbi:MAG: hypothetical protein ACOVNS_03420 [Erythrobacter sp.]
MSELDSSLRQLASLPVPLGLDLIDDMIIAGFAAQRREASFGKRATVLAGAFALLLGLTTGGLVTGPPAQAQAIAPFASDNPLAPSNLLDVHP